MFVDPDGMRVILGRNIVDDRELTTKEIVLLVAGMQSMTDDKLKYNGDTGEVEIVEQGEGEKGEGTKLIRDLIGHKNTTTIDYAVSSETNQDGRPFAMLGESEKGENAADAMNGNGTNSNIRIGVGHSIITQDFETGEFGEEVMTTSDLLTHGLIHSLGTMNGESRGTPDVAEKVSVYYTDSQMKNLKKI